MVALACIGFLGTAGVGLNWFMFRKPGQTKVEPIQLNVAAPIFPNVPISRSNMPPPLPKASSLPPASPAVAAKPTLPPRPKNEDRFVQVFPLSASRAQSGITVSISYESRDARFLQDARKLHSKEGKTCEPVPFFQYWPTYRAMNNQQLAWYFYWRSQVRRGNFLETDLSYIFVHVYEVLSLVEFGDPLQSAARIKALRDAYIQQHPKLDNYLPEWGGDLLAVKATVARAFDWWQPFVMQGALHSPPIVNVIIEREMRSGKAKDLPYALWVQLANYRPRNKFYQQYNEGGKLDRAYEQALHTADEYWRSETNQSVLEKFTGKSKEIRKPVFTSALVGYDHPPTVDLGASRNYLGNTLLGDHLAMVCKYSENILRKQLKFSGRLSGIKLDAGLMEALDTAFTPKPAGPRPYRLTLDPSRVASLTAENEQISAILQPSAEEAPSALAKPLYTDLAEVRQLWSELGDSHRHLIEGIFEKQFTTLNEWTNGTAADLLPNSAIDRINVRALTLLGDRLIYLEDDGRLSLAEDFLDELDVVLKEQTSQVTQARAASSDDPFDQLFVSLPQVEIYLIETFAALGKLTEAEIDTLARPYHVMGNAALDSLNEKAADALGHPLLYLDNDEWVLDEQDLAALRQHLAGMENLNADSKT